MKDDAIISIMTHSLHKSLKTREMATVLKTTVLKTTFENKYCQPDEILVQSKNENIRVESFLEKNSNT